MSIKNIIFISCTLLKERSSVPFSQGSFKVCVSMKCVCVGGHSGRKRYLQAVLWVINKRFSIAKLLCFLLHTAKRHLLAKRSGREVGCIQYKPSASSAATRRERKS